MDARTPQHLREYLALATREAEGLLAEITYTAAALDLARATLARRDGKWVFAGGNRQRHALLRALANRSTGPTTPDLARHLRCSRQTTHRLATALSRRGLVDIEVCPNDRRTFLVFINAAGRTALADADASAAPCVQAIAGGLEVREMRALATALRRIRERAAALRR